MSGIGRGKDEFYMDEALKLGRGVRGRTFPNPAVGAVIVRSGRIVGRGATRETGGPHAERVALEDAGGRARGATMYVTLEPCCHFGRTPPCTDAIVEAGIGRVVAPLRDPAAHASGKGFRRLRKAGIRVDTGVGAVQARREHEAYLWSTTRRRAWVTLKLAVTLDGRIADTRGGSRWITSVGARRMVQELRKSHAAVAVGSGTLIKDNPRLTVRTGSSRCNPARIVFSSSTHIPSGYRLGNVGPGMRTILVVPGGSDRRHAVRSDGIEVWHTGTRDYVGSMHVFLAMARERELPSILVEGGSRIASVLLDNGMVNRLYLFMGNKILGAGTPALEFGKPRKISRALRLRNMEIQPRGSEVMITGIPTGG